MNLADLCKNKKPTNNKINNNINNKQVKFTPISGTLGFLNTNSNISKNSINENSQLSQNSIFNNINNNNSNNRINIEDDDKENDNNVNNATMVTEINTIKEEFKEYKKMVLRMNEQLKSVKQETLIIPDLLNKISTLESEVQRLKESKQVYVHMEKKRKTTEDVIEYSKKCDEIKYNDLKDIIKMAYLSKCHPSKQRDALINLYPFHPLVEIVCAKGEESKDRYIFKCKEKRDTIPDTMSDDSVCVFVESLCPAENCFNLQEKHRKCCRQHREKHTKTDKSDTQTPILTTAAYTVMEDEDIEKENYIS